MDEETRKRIMAAAEAQCARNRARMALESKGIYPPPIRIVFDRADNSHKREKK